MYKCRTSEHRSLMKNEATRLDRLYSQKQHNMHLKVLVCFENFASDLLVFVNYAPL